MIKKIKAKIKSWVNWYVSWLFSWQKKDKKLENAKKMKDWKHPR